MAVGVQETCSPTDTVGPLLDDLDQTLTQLIDSVGHDELTRAGDDALVGFLRRFEEIRNRMGRVDHEIVHACEATDLPHRLQVKSVGNLLVQTTRIDPGQAYARVRATHAFRADHTMTGQPLAPKWARLAAAVAAGLVPSGQADRAVKCLNKVERLPWASPDEVAKAETALATNAVAFRPEEFKAVVQRVLDHNDPDGTLPDDQFHEAARGVTIYQARDGSVRIEGRFTPEVGAQITAVLNPLRQPQPGAGGDDLRTLEERTHDAIAEVFTRILRSGDVPDTGGLPTTVVVTIDYRHLLNKTGHGTLPDGTPIAPHTLLNSAVRPKSFPSSSAPSEKCWTWDGSRGFANKPQTLP